MKLDERASEILDLVACRQYLTLGAGVGLHGHLGMYSPCGPTVLPFDYAMDEGDVILRVGAGVRDQVIGCAVAFLVDNECSSPAGAVGDSCWSVLVRGRVLDVTAPRDAPIPRVVAPGESLIRIEAEEITGRRLHSCSRLR